MSGEENLKALLKNMSPVLGAGEYVFITLQGNYGDHFHLNPLFSFQEEEGLTLVVTRDMATSNGLIVEEAFRMITLEVHSSLNAVGLTAAVAAKLSEEGISANVVAAFHHDHIFVQTLKADRALKALIELTE